MAQHPAALAWSPTAITSAMRARPSPHTGWDAVRAGVDSEGGWPLYLHRYVELLAA